VIIIQLLISWFLYMVVLKLLLLLSHCEAPEPEQLEATVIPESTVYASHTQKDSCASVKFNILNLLNLLG